MTRRSKVSAAPIGALTNVMRQDVRRQAGDSSKMQLLQLDTPFQRDKAGFGGGFEVDQGDKAGFVEVLWRFCEGLGEVAWRFGGGLGDGAGFRGGPLPTRSIVTWAVLTA